MRLHQWRLDLANQVELIEQEMQKRQDERNEDPNPWWWVPFVRDLLIEFSVEMLGGEALVILYHFGRGNYVDALIELLPFDMVLKGNRRLLGEFSDEATDAIEFMGREAHGNFILTSNQTLNK